MMCFRSIGVRPVLAVFAAAAVLAGCAHQPGSPGAPPKPDDKLQVFQVQGVVEKLEANGKTVVIRHEKIPNYMDAMTMPLEVKDTRELIGLAPGDVVRFRMLVTADEGWIDRLQKIGATNTTATFAVKPRDPFRRAPIVEPLNVGDAVPDYRFTNQFGQPISLGQFNGRALAVVFIYTRCPYPNFCPRMANNLLDVQKKLKALPDAPTNWHLLSITFDPAYDTPARLRAYAETWRYDPARWSFATADLWTIDGITEQFGMQFWREDNAVIGHNVRAAVLDPKGRVRRLFSGNEWKPEEMVEELVKAASL